MHGALQDVCCMVAARKAQEGSRSGGEGPASRSGGLMQETSPIMHLRDMNPYVATALGDWQSKLSLTPAIPLGHAPQAFKHLLDSSAGV